MINLLYITIGYFIGCIQTAYIVGRIKGIDLRDKGSGNLGATNAIRVLGAKAGLLTFVIDVLKAVIAFMLVKYAFDAGDIGGLYAGLGTVLGHNFPFYLKFSGGKGIAVTGGIMLAIDPIITLVVVAVMVAIIACTKYVSVGSIFLMVSLIVLAIAKYYTDIEIMVLMIVLGSLGIVMHRSNIKRLLTHKENKLNFSKKDK